MTPTMIIASAEVLNTPQTYTTTMRARQHTLLADEPGEIGGADKGAAPGEYLCMALASCKAITLRMYADRKQWAIGDIKVTVKLVKGDQMSSGRNTFYCEVKFTGAITGEQERRLLEIARKCPVDRLLSKPSDMVTIIE
jgi:putative redox protein